MPEPTLTDRRPRSNVSTTSSRPQRIVVPMKIICVISSLGFAASCLVSLPLRAQTQVPQVARLGLLSDYEKFGASASPSDWLAAFRAGLHESGYVEGKNVLLEFRFADRDPAKLARMATELASMKVDVIVAASTTAAKAAKAATHTIPIVFWGAEPVSSGLVANLDQPGENLTGVTANEEQQKEFLAQLKEVMPGLNRVAILLNRSYAPVPGILKNAESGARELGLAIQLVEVSAPGDLPAAFASMKRERVRAVLVLNHRMFFEERAKVAALAIENGIAVSTPYLPSAEAGALIAHEADFDKVWRINARYIDKILKGVNPGDLPVERLPAFRYAVNLKTAKLLGITIPNSILKQATAVVPDSVDADDANRATDEAAIRKLIADHNEAFNRHDGSGTVYFTDDADTRNIVGAFFTGKAEIEKLSVALDKSFGNTQRIETIQRIRFLTPEIALVDSVADSTGYIIAPDGTKLPPDKGLMSHKVVVKKDGRWLITAVRNALPGHRTPVGSLPATPNRQAQEAPTTGDDNPFMGTWKLNLVKSKIVGPEGARPLPITKSVVTFEPAGEQVKVIDDDTFADGHSIHMEWSGKLDGEDYPVTGDSNADTWSYKKINDRTLILTTKSDGKVQATREITVSADGKTRTVTGIRMDTNGRKASITAVYEKE